MNKYRKSQLMDKHIQGRRQCYDCYNVDGNYIDLKDSVLLLHGSVYEKAYLRQRVMP